MSLSKEITVSIHFIILTMRSKRSLFLADRRSRVSGDRNSIFTSFHQSFSNYNCTLIMITLFIFQEKKCPDCSYRTKHSGHFNVHREGHLNVRGHVCRVCGKAFKRLYHHDRHILKHNIVRHQCDHVGCQYKTPHKALLAAHKKKHH